MHSFFQRLQLGCIRANFRDTQTKKTQKMSEHANSTTTTTSTPTSDQTTTTTPISEQLLYECPQNSSLHFQVYTSEAELPPIKQLMDVDLSEPYSVYTYRYFVNNWPELCIMTIDTSSSSNNNDDDHQTTNNNDDDHNKTNKNNNSGKIMGAIVCKCDEHSNVQYGITKMRGYIAMLAVDSSYRKRGIGRALVARAIEAMRESGAREVVLETECVNRAALGLYEGLGFIREKRLHKYYLNQGSAYRLKLDL